MTLSLVAPQAAQAKHHLHFDPCEILFRLAEIGAGAGGMLVGAEGSITYGLNIAADIADPANLALDVAVIGLGLFATAKSGALLWAGLTPEHEVAEETTPVPSNLKIMPRAAPAGTRPVSLAQAA